MNFLIDMVVDKTVDAVVDAAIDAAVDAGVDTVVDEAVDAGIETVQDAAVEAGVNEDLVEAAGDLAENAYDDAKEDFLNGDDDDAGDDNEGDTIVDETVDKGIAKAQNAALEAGVNEDLVEHAGDLAENIYDDAKDDFLNGDDDDEKDPNDETEMNAETKKAAVKEIVKTAVDVTKLAACLLVAWSGEPATLTGAVVSGAKVLNDFRKLRKRFKKNDDLHPSKKYQGSWAVTSIEGVMDHLTTKHGKLC